MINSLSVCNKFINIPIQLCDVIVNSFWNFLLSSPNRPILLVILQNLLYNGILLYFTMQRNG